MASEYDDIRLLTQSPAQVVFKYHVPMLDWSSDADGPFPRMARCALRRESGHPPVPGRIVYVALPPGAHSVLVDLVDIGGDHGGANTALALRSNGEAPPYPYPSERVMLDKIFTLRGLRLARIILHPLTVETAAGDYRLAVDMTVRVRFNAPADAGNTAGVGGDDVFTGIVDQLVLNPGQARGWRLPVHKALARPSLTPDPFAGATQWVAVYTGEEGVFDVTGRDLEQAGIDWAGVDPSRIRMFAGPGRMLSTTMSDPPPQLAEIAITVRDGGDGRFDSADTVEFYAESLNRWDVDADGAMVDVVNRYTRSNVYWLVAGGDFTGAPKRIAARSALPEPAATPVFSARDRVRHERDVMFRVGSIGYIDSYYTWYWRNQQTGPISLFAVRNAVPGTSAVIEVGAYFIAPRLLVNGVAADTLPSRPAGEDRTRITRFLIPAFDPGADYVLDFADFRSGHYLDYYSVEYQRRLTLASGAFRFPAPDTDDRLTLVVTDVNAPRVWDVSDPDTPVALTAVAVSGNTARFDVDQRDGSRHRFYVFEPAQRLSPDRLRLVERGDLYHPATGADYLVIGPRAFRSPMADFMSYRSATDGLTMRFVAVEDIYDEFAFGLFDPVAIRRFLRHVFREWPDRPPTYVLLAGDGSYDFLDHTGANSVNYVPPYIVADDNSISDENYVYFSDKKVLDSDGGDGENIFPDMLIARWPVKTAAEIQNITAKIKRYESNENLGPWRSRAVLIADDEFGDRSSNPPSVTETFHIRDAEDIARFYIPPSIDLQKIYLTEFPFDNPGCKEPRARGCRKPTVNIAIRDALNRGAGILDYIGHGNADLFAHERVFVRTQDLPQLTNAGMATAVLTFSCSIGFFDRPNSEGMSEEWLRMPDAGAVAVISATRLVTAGANAALNEKVFDLLLNRKRTGIAASLYTGKLLRQYFARCSVCPEVPCPCNNDRRYVLFGDPAMKLGIPLNRVEFTSIEPDTLAALSLTRVEGRIVDTTGEPMSDFEGTAFVTVRDSPRQRLYRVNESKSIAYELPGGTLYRGEVPVTAGRFDFAFIVPKDIAYGRRGARIIAHASSADAMAAGVADSLWIAGSVGALSDTTGPSIRLESAAGEPITDGFRLPLGTEVIAYFSDSSGINLTGAPGHRLEVSAGDDTRPLVDLTDGFSYDPGRFDRGHAAFTVTGIDKGRQDLVIKAWDNANNSSRRTVMIEVVDAGATPTFAVNEFLNYPNPFSDLTTFYFTTSRAYEQARIRIFTLAGRLIWQLQGAVDGVTRWDGIDLDGDPVGNGVYLVQLEVTGRVNESGRMVDKTAYREMKIVLSR